MVNRVEQSSKDDGPTDRHLCHGVHDHDINPILLVVKVDRHSRGFDPEPRLISDVIAAFITTT
jgi:hypothetical protein